MAFSTWSDLRKKMLDDFASGNWRTKSYDIDGIRREFFSPEEFFTALEKVDQKAAVESEQPVLRTLARGANR